MRLPPPMVLLLAGALAAAAAPFPNPFQRDAEEVAEAAGPADVTRVTITGCRSISEEEVRRAIEGRLAHVRSQPANRARASDAAFLVEQLFRLRGFNDAVVYWKITGPSAIRLRVDEGPRESLGEVGVLGVPDKDRAKRLQELFRLPFEKRVVNGETPPFEQALVDEGLGFIVAELESISFWTARAELEKRRTNPGTGAVDVLVRVHPGPSHTIATPTFDAAEAGDLLAATRGSVGKPATTTEINRIRLEVGNYYEDRGFVDAKIRMNWEIRDGRLHPAIAVTRGKRYTIGKVDFTGLEKTDPERIAVRLRDLEGRPANQGLGARRIRQIIATGAFSTVRLEKKPRAGDILDATLHFEEGKARGVSLTAGGASFYGPIFGASYYDRNFRGKLRNFNAGFELTGRSLLGEVSIADPWIMGTDLSGKARLFSLSKSYEGFDTWRTGLEASLAWPVTDHYLVTAALGWAYVSNSPDGVPRNNMGETEYGNPYLRITQRLDFRDNPVLPSSGWHLEMPFEIGSSIGDDSTAYLKLGLGGSYHYPLSDKDQLALGLRGGILVPAAGGSSNLPIDLRYFNGGARSVRSFRELEQGPRAANGYWIGGESYFVANLEYIREVAGPLKAVAFVDAGGLDTAWEDFGFGNPDLAAGLGIRLDLPIGPVRFEYGHNLTQDPGEPSGAWHFAIGTTF